jgi:proteic killer suppression protein
MEIRNIKHKGLKAFVEKGQTKDLQSQYIDKIRDVMTFLLDMEAIEEFFDLKKYRPHRLTGDRGGTYSLSVAPNWRITFRHDAATNELFDLDYEDYH